MENYNGACNDLNLGYRYLDGCIGAGIFHPTLDAFQTAIYSNSLVIQSTLLDVPKEVSKWVDYVQPKNASTLE